MKIGLILLSVSLLTGCATTKKINQLEDGMLEIAIEAVKSIQNISEQVKKNYDVHQGEITYLKLRVSELEELMTVPEVK